MLYFPQMRTESVQKQRRCLQSFLHHPRTDPLDMRERNFPKEQRLNHQLDIKQCQIKRLMSDVFFKFFNCQTWTWLYRLFFKTGTTFFKILNQTARENIPEHILYMDVFTINVRSQNIKFIKCIYVIFYFLSITFSNIYSKWFIFAIKYIKIFSIRDFYFW